MSIYRDGKVRHIRINRDANGLFNFMNDSADAKSVKRFESVHDMVKYLENHEKCSLNLTTKYKFDFFSLECLKPKF